jgi:molybdopterin synthase catalytic subunit
MADRPKAPSKQEEVEVIVPPTEVVIAVAAHTYTREQCMDMVRMAIDATKQGLPIRFA